jgi:hypothetical protein
MSSERLREIRKERKGVKESGTKDDGQLVGSVRHRTVARIETHEREGGKTGLLIACCSARRGPGFILGVWDGAQVTLRLGKEG